MMSIEISERDQNTGDAMRARTALPRTLFGDVVQVIDYVLVIALSVIVATVYHSIAVLAFDLQYYVVAGIIGATVFTALLRRDGYYEFERLVSAMGSMRALMSRWAMVILALLAFGFSLKVSENFSRVWLFAWTFSVIITISISRAISAPMLRALSKDGGVFARRVAVVGATELGNKFREQVNSEQNGISIVGVFDAGLPSQGDDYFGNIAGDLSDLDTLARSGAIDDIVIATPRTSSEDMSRVVRRLSDLPVSIAICPNVHWLDHTGGAVNKVGDATVLSLYRRPLDGWGGVIKTIEDFALGAVILLLVSPLMLAIAAAIKLQGKGPVLFAQQRHGFNNAVFKIYKFRTMTVAEDGETIVQAQENDPRITPIGKFLRHYSLDELPQLLNVIKGEMSLVGPRPHALAHNHQYARMIENYSGRHKVKPGITGWAQVNGFRGETSENEQMAQRVRYDLAYIDDWSIWFDIKILILTARAVVFPKNAV